MNDRYTLLVALLACTFSFAQEIDFTSCPTQVALKSVQFDLFNKGKVVNCNQLSLLGEENNVMTSWNKYVKTKYEAKAGKKKRLYTVESLTIPEVSSTPVSLSYAIDHEGSTSMLKSFVNGGPLTDEKSSNGDLNKKFEQVLKEFAKVYYLETLAEETKKEDKVKTKLVGEIDKLTKETASADKAIATAKTDIESEKSDIQKTKEKIHELEQKIMDYEAEIKSNEAKIVETEKKKKFLTESTLAENEKLSKSTDRITKLNQIRSQWEQN